MEIRERMKKIRKNGKTVENVLWKWEKTVENCFNRKKNQEKGANKE